MALTAGAQDPAAPARRLLPGLARTAETFRTRPRWAGRFFVLAALYVLLGLAGNADRIALTERHLPPSVSGAGRASADAVLSGGTAVRSLFLPVRLFIGWSLFALLLHYTCGIWRTGQKSRYVMMLAAEVYAEGALFAGSAAAYAAASLNPSPAVPWIPLGLDMVLPAGDFTARYVLNSVNVFAAAYVAVLVILVSVLLGIPRTKATVSVLLAWAGALLVNAGVVHALRTEFGFGL